ncbi:MFS transporter [Lacisediminihabitans profunda]|uniref:SLC45 family MFS transporter n=1 Tax=Lacisediminihabitans profunda TaxID=2594790 RepID=A0A5C8UU91_9MICO|nr:MFS transporter [Lacisediminihabitans profunda]TXN31138.1 SLC45 family MFS transporter [Lacisediminihabitans profunda]
MTTPETAHAPAPFAEPRARVRGRWISLFAAAWLGVWMAQLTPIQLLLPLQIEARVHSSDWVDSVVAFGVVSGIAGVFALVAFPLTGALSDRTTSRFGRRRPWILGGALLFAAGLVALGAQTGILGIGVFWSVALVGFCVLSAALTAMISDQVPVNQRGYVSGWISAPQAIGTILGLLLVVVLGLGIFAGYTLVAVLVVLLVLPFVLGVPDAVLAPADRPRLTGRGLIAGFWISPREHPDFGWTLLSRILVNFGNAFGTALLLQFLQYGLHRPHASDDLLVLVAVYLVFVVIASLVSGRLSDRLGLRKVFVFVAAALQGVAALLLAFVPEFAVAIVAAGILGLGYGCFLSVDQALATQVLPDVHTRGKDLGIMNIATAVPQAVAPLIGAFVVAAFAGFQSLFVLSALAALLGAAAVLPIRSVR